MGCKGQVMAAQKGAWKNSKVEVEVDQECGTCESLLQPCIEMSTVLAQCCWH
jgi:hypothetical protein